MGANPEGLTREPRRDLYYFIHNVYANFFKDTLDYLSLHLVPRSQHRLISTYDKAVQYLNDYCNTDGREMDRPNLPAIIINPSGEFAPAEAMSGGKQLWRYPNLAPGMIKRIFEPVYKYDNTEVYVSFMRMAGDIEMLFLLNSFYEYCDIKMLLLQIFGGFERWIYPQFFTTFIILPEELVNYTYTNEYTGVTNTLDWEKFGAYDRLVKTINSNELVIPCNIKPIYKLTSLSDGSTRYGGADDMAEWKLAGTLNFEIEIPTYLVLNSDYKVDKIDVNLEAGSAYSIYNSFEPPELKIERTCPTISDSTSSNGICCEPTEYKFHTRYYHIVSQAEADSTSNIVITLPEEIYDTNSLIVNSKYGEMNYGDHYIVETDGKTLIIKTDNVELLEGMVIELFIYIPE